MQQFSQATFGGTKLTRGQALVWAGVAPLAEWGQRCVTHAAYFCALYISDMSSIPTFFFFKFCPCTHRRQGCRKPWQQGMFFMISQVIFSINNWHISPAKSLVFTTIAWVNRQTILSSTQPYIVVWPFVLVRHEVLDFFSGKIWLPTSSCYLCGLRCCS